MTEWHLDFVHGTYGHGKGNQVAVQHWRDGKVVREVEKRLKTAFQADASLDLEVRARIESLSRKVPEGSREWEILYRQYSEELARRRG